MSAPHNPDIDLRVGRGHGLHRKSTDVRSRTATGAIVMAELAHRCDFPAVRVDVSYCSPQRSPHAAMACMIAGELDRNEIWD